MSLLSYLYPRIRGSQEDVATLALAYILNQSKALADCFTKKLCGTLDVPHTKQKVFYKTQQTGESRERPDLCGYSKDGKELYVCEEKFYASLTDNQPQGYIARLRKSGGHGLIFICPEGRMTSLYRQLFDRCPDAVERDSVHFITSEGIPVGLISWGEILSSLKNTAETQDVSFIADIDQLIDFCKIIDSDAYPPFVPEDFGADMPRKIERYQVVINRIAQKMLADQSRRASTKGLQGRAYSEGFVKYINTNGYAVTLLHSRYAWRMPGIADTPFWLSFKPKWGMNNKEFMEKLPVEDYMRYQNQDGCVFIALIPKPYLTMEETADDLLQQIDYYFSLAKEL